MSTTLQTQTMYRISSYSFRGNYSFLNLTLCTVTFDHSTYRCGNYSREETIQGRKLYEEIRYVVFRKKKIESKVVNISVAHLWKSSAWKGCPPLESIILQYKRRPPSGKALLVYRASKKGKKSYTNLTTFFMSTWWMDCKNIKKKKIHGGFSR